MKLLLACTLCLASAMMLCAFQPQRLSLPDDGAEPGDHFGSGIASWGDWAAVSAPADTSGTGNYYGAVYMYQKVDGEWLLRQKLRQSEPRTKEAYFGGVLTMQAGTLVVSCAGKAMIFTLNADQWLYHTTLSDPTLSIRSMSLHGGTLALGFASTDYSQAQAVVRLYSGVGSVWTQEAALMSQPGVGNENFGWALAVGEARLLVGAPAGSGCVYGYEKISGLWTRTSVLTQPDCRRFGTAIVIKGTRAMIAAPHVDGSYQSPDVLGRICFYQHTASGWALERAVRPAPSGAQWPTAGEIRGVIDMDGDMAIFETNQGEVLYTMSLLGEPDSWLIRNDKGNVVTDALAPVTAPPPVTPGINQLQQSFSSSDSWPYSDIFNVNTESVLVSGEWWQGFYTVGPGSYPPDNVGRINRRIRQDHAWVMPATQPSIQPLRSLLQEEPSFGTALLSGDLAVVSATYHPDLGHVRTMHRVSGQWQWAHFNRAPIIGSLKALDGERLVTSQIDFWTGLIDRRHVTLFQYDGTDWRQETTFEMEHDYGDVTTFESGVDLDGETLAYAETSGGGSESYVKVLHHDGSAWREQARLKTPNKGRYAGVLVALDGDVLATTDKIGHRMMGAPQGSLLLYHRQNGQWTLEASFAATPKVLEIDPGLQNSTQLLTLRGNRVAVGSISGGRYGVQVYERQGTKWKRLASPTLPVGISPRALSWAGDALLIETDKKPGNDAALWVLQGSVWKPSVSLRSAVDPEDTILARAASADTVLVANRGEILRDDGVYFDAPDVPELLFFDLTSMSIQDGPASPVSPALAEGGVLDFGQVMVAEKTTRAITISNDTPLPLTLTGMSFSGVQAAEFKLQMSVTTLKSGQSKTYPIEHLPRGAGTRAATLRVENSGRALSFRLISEAVTKRVTPRMTMETTAFFKPEHSALTLAPKITGTHPYQCQWLKNGRAVSGAVYPVLHLDSLKPADAGLYRLIISSPSSKVEGPEIAVGVYRPVRRTIMAKLGQEVTMKAYAWGPDLDWRWNVEESAFVRGSRTDTLRLLRPELNPDMWVPALYMRDAYAEPARFDIDITRAPYPPSVLWEGNWGVGESVEGFRVDSDINEENPHYLVSGLPPGVRLDAVTGELSGAPTRVGTYRIEWRVQARGMTSQALVTTLYVDSNIPKPGLHAGTLPVSEYLPKGGFATLSMTSSGAYSVKLQTGARITRVAGSIGGDIFERYHSLPPAPGTTKTLLRVADSSWLQLIFEKAPDFYEDEGFSLQAIESSGVQSSPLPAGLMFTQPLRISDEESRPELPQGSGFASIRMSGVRTANLVGTLPDGSGITASGPVASTAGNQGPQDDSLLVYFCPTASSDWVAGSVELNSLRGSNPNDSTAQLLWGHIAHPGAAAYPSAFDPVYLRGRGAPYFPPTSGMLMLPLLMEPEYLLRVMLSGGGLSGDDMSFGHLTVAHKAVFPLPNTGRTMLDFYVPTGFFTGSHTFAVPLRRTVGLRGMLVPAWNEGHGLFLLPGADSKVRSGRLYLDAAPILEP